MKKYHLFAGDIDPDGGYRSMDQFCGSFESVIDALREFEHGKGKQYPVAKIFVTQEDGSLKEGEWIEKKEDVT